MWNTRQSKKILVAGSASFLFMNAIGYSQSNTNASSLSAPTTNPSSTTVAPTSATGAKRNNVISSEPVNGLGVPMGTGPGVHSPNSPFKPLVDRSDVIAWPVLTSVKTKLVKGRIVPQYAAAQTNLHKTTQRVQGYMMPLDAGKKQVHFILSSVPLTCQFCIPGGPESMVEVKTKTPVAYSTQAVVVEGQFLVLENDPYGLYYRMVDAVGVK